MTKINMGCGHRNFGDDWVHIDGGNYEHLDYNDITSLTQFSDGSVDLIYASHVIEYFDRFEVVNVLNEWNRVLKRGGKLRLAVPDFYQLAKLYYLDRITVENVVGPLYGRMKMDSETIYHRTVYDFKSLSDVLLRCNFKNIEKYDWRSTEHANFDDHSQAYMCPYGDKDNGILISLNVEAVK